jgi:hypothetical protein
MEYDWSGAVSFNKLFLFYSFTLSSGLFSCHFWTCAPVLGVDSALILCYVHRYVEHLNQHTRHAFVFLKFVTIYKFIAIHVLNDMFYIILIVYF